MIDVMKMFKDSLNDDVIAELTDDEIDTVYEILTRAGY